MFPQRRSFRDGQLLSGGPLSLGKEAAAPVTPAPAPSLDFTKPTNTQFLALRSIGAG